METCDVRLMMLDCSLLIITMVIKHMHLKIELEKQSEFFLMILSDKYIGKLERPFFNLLISSSLFHQSIPATILNVGNKKSETS